ncbi:hypothetical protein [Pseudooceanicola sp. 200-1SW]|uniref:hypothetical protein n=1 Tax=Pseudooceanicola sp. 200-1SW TaxID=3425949 RepID=UPI003D7FD4CA
MRNALIIPAIAAASLTAIPAFAYDGPISDVKTDVVEESVQEGKFPAAYVDTINDDVEAALMTHFESPVEDGEGLHVEASILGMELTPDMGTMAGQVAVFEQNGDIITTFNVELEADTLTGVTDPNAYYGPMVEKFAAIAAEHIAELPVNDPKEVIGEAPTD